MDREEKLIREIQSAKTLDERAEKVSEYQRVKLDRLRDENTEYQRRSKMTQDERSRAAVVTIAAKLKEQAHKEGREEAFEKHRKHAEEIAERSERKRI
jgi:hypothetical protein